MGGPGEGTERRGERVRLLRGAATADAGFATPAAAFRRLARAALDLVAAPVACRAAAEAKLGARLRDTHGAAHPRRPTRPAGLARRARAALDLVAAPIAGGAA